MRGGAVVEVWFMVFGGVYALVLLGALVVLWKVPLPRKRDVPDDIPLDSLLRLLDRQG